MTYIYLTSIALLYIGALIVLVDTIQQVQKLDLNINDEPSWLRAEEELS